MVLKAVEGRRGRSISGGSTPDLVRPPLYYFPDKELCAREFWGSLQMPCGSWKGMKFLLLDGHQMRLCEGAGMYEQRGRKAGRGGSGSQNFVTKSGPHEVFLS